MFKAKTNFKPVEIRRQTVKEYSSGTYKNGIDEDLPINSALLIRNYELTESGSLRSRKAFRNSRLLTLQDGLNDTKVVSAIGNFKTAGSDYLLSAKGGGLYVTEGPSLSTSWKAGTLPGDTLLGNRPAYFKQAEISLSGVSTSYLSSTISEASSERYVKTASVMQPNEHVGRYLHIGSERSVITGNTADTIYTYGTFDSAYSSGTSFSILGVTPCFVYGVHGSENNRYFYGAPSSGSDFTMKYYGDSETEFPRFSDFEKHKGRYFYTRIAGDTKVLYFSETGIANSFKRDNFIRFESAIKRIVSFGDRLVVFTETDIAYLFGDSPDNYYVEYKKTNKLLAFPESVAIGNNTLLYVSNQGGTNFIESLDRVDNNVADNSFGISSVVSDYMKMGNGYDFPHCSAIWNNQYWLAKGRYVIVFDMYASSMFQKPIFYVHEIADESKASVNPSYPDSAGRISAISNAQGQLHVSYNGWIGANLDGNFCENGSPNLQHAVYSNPTSSLTATSAESFARGATTIAYPQSITVSSSDYVQINSYDKYPNLSSTGTSSPITESTTVTFDGSDSATVVSPTYSDSTPNTGGSMANANGVSIVGTNVGQYSYNDLTIESNSINFGDSFREKVWKRLDVKFGDPKKDDPSSCSYIFRVSLSFDGSDYVLYKQTTDHEFKIFLTKKSVSIKYKIQAIPQGRANVPLELLQIDIGFEPEHKF